MLDSWVFLLLLLVVGVAILVAIARWIRAVALWYWRVDEGIDLLQEIRDELRELNRRADRGDGGDVLEFPRRATRDRIEPR
jgi:hypothetical protein